MAIDLYELCGADPEIRFSPNVWRTKLALAHKGLDVNTINWRFTEKDAIAFSGQGAVPVIKDGERSVVNSWDIALYLEETYSDRPSLFGGPSGIATASFVQNWADRTAFACTAPIVILDVWSILDDTDKAYFRESREARFGKPLEEICGDRDARVENLRKAMEPMRVTVAKQDFLGGDAPLYHDYVVFGSFIWARCVSDVTLFDAEDPMQGWMERMLDLYDGMARTAKTAKHAA